MRNDCLVAGIAAALSCSAASADVVLDQNFMPYPSNQKASLSWDDGTFGRAMTFTVGVAGVLDSIDIRESFPVSTLRILQTSGGVPIGGLGGSTVLATASSFTTLIGGPSDDQLYRYDLSSAGLVVEVGDVLAIEPVQPAGHTIFWWGSFSDSATYAGGGDYYFSAGSPTWVSTPNDMHFRTYVDVSVPEPTSVALLGLGGLLIARRRRQG